MMKPRRGMIDPSNPLKQNPNNQVVIHGLLFQINQVRLQILILWKKTFKYAIVAAKMAV